MDTQSLRRARQDVLLLFLPGHAPAPGAQRVADHRSHGETPAYLDEANYLSQNTGRTWLNQSACLTDTHIFNPHVTHQVLFSFNRTDGVNIPIYPPKTFKDLGINIYNDDKPQWYVA